MRLLKCFHEEIWILIGKCQFHSVQLFAGDGIIKSFRMLEEIEHSEWGYLCSELIMRGGNGQGGGILSTEASALTTFSLKYGIIYTA